MLIWITPREIFVELVSFLLSPEVKFGCRIFKNGSRDWKIYTTMVGNTGQCGTWTGNI